MRLCLALLLLSTAAHAETIEATGRVSAVTLYPQGAITTRTISFTAPAPGRHEVIVPGLPQDTDPPGLRVQPSTGVTVGALTLATDRQPVVGDQTPPEVAEARARVAGLEAILDEKRRGIDAIRARGEAAQAQADFLQRLAMNRAEAVDALPTPEELRALAGLVGEQVLAARETALQAEVEAKAAERDLEPDLKALEQARAALAALDTGVTDGATLVLTIDAAAAGEAVVTVEALTGGAGWTPTYDLRLARKPDLLTIDRGVMVFQHTGEDWRDVALTLSTAQPGNANAPDQLFAIDRRIVPEPRAEQGYESASADYDSSTRGAYAEPAVEAAIVGAVGGGFTFATEMAGTSFSYSFASPVTVPSGDSLRLTLESLETQAAVRAEGVPLYDETAFLMADITNTTGQPLLPGQAMLYLDGALVGSTGIDLIPPQGKASIGFGAIHGLVLDRITPARSEGETGILTSSNRQVEEAVITVENLTGETWPIQIIDRVPYSEQDDLKIAWKAVPPPTATDIEGRRGVMAWTFDIAPGAKQVIRLDQMLDWPSGYVLE